MANTWQQAVIDLAAGRHMPRCCIRFTMYPGYCSHGCALRPGRIYLFIYLFIYPFYLVTGCCADPCRCPPSQGWHSHRSSATEAAWNLTKRSPLSVPNVTTWLLGRLVLSASPALNSLAASSLGRQRSAAHNSSSTYLQELLILRCLAVGQGL